MQNTDTIIHQALANGSELAAEMGEGFVLAVTAAYIAGTEAGKLAAQGAV